MIVAHLTRSARIQRRQVYRLLGKGRLKRLVIKDSGLHRPPGCETFLQRYSQRSPRLFHSLQHLQQQFLLKREKFVVIGRRHVRHDVDIERIGAYSNETHW